MVHLLTPHRGGVARFFPREFLTWTNPGPYLGIIADFSRFNKGLLYPRRMEHLMSDICLMPYLEREKEGEGERERDSSDVLITLYLLIT